MSDLMVNGIAKTVPLEKFYTFVRPLVGTTVPDAVISHNLQIAATWFARETRILTDTYELHLQPNVKEYAIKLPPGRFLLAPHIPGKHLNIGDWIAYFFHADFNSVQAQGSFERDGIYPVLKFGSFPRKEVKRVFHYSWMPDQDFGELPWEFYQQWNRAIAYKTASEIMMTPQEDWSDASRAASYNEIAEKEKAVAIRRKVMNFSGGRRQMKAKKFLPPSYGIGFWGQS